MSPHQNSDTRDYLAIEADARALRARVMAEGFGRLWALIAGALRGHRRHVA